MEVVELTTITLVFLIAASLIAGFIDTLVGGGGLITIPALMAAGVPPIFALGTNKLQAVAGSGAASLSLLLRRQIRFRSVRIKMLLAFVGSLVGSVMVQFFNADVLKIVVPVVIILIAIYFIAAPSRSLLARAPRISEAKYTATAVPGIGFYDGMFGPGTGSFFVLAGVSLQGQAIVYSTIVAKTLNFATNIAALLVFAYFGKILWMVGGAMMIGQFVGATIGARTLLVINPQILRYLVIVMCIVILAAWGFKSA